MHPAYHAVLKLLDMHVDNTIGEGDEALKCMPFVITMETMEIQREL